MTRSSGEPDTAGGSPAPARPLRRDAVRNRRRLLEAAREVFAERGLSVTLDDVARHAGLGVGTIYRHFPKKDVLVEALFEDHLDRMVAVTNEALVHPEPWRGLVDTVLRLADELSADLGLRDVLLDAEYSQGRLAAARDRLTPAVGAVVHRAQQAGVLRADVEATDFPVVQFLMGSLGEYTHHIRPTLHRRYLTLLLEGMRRRADLEPLTEPALSPSEFEQVRAPRRAR